MTTPPLDLPALRAKLRITKVTDNAEVLALLARVEELERNWMQECGNYESALNRAESAEKAVAAVRELHTKEKHGVQHHCGECLQDDNTGSWEYVEWPCPTVTALDSTP